MAKPKLISYAFPKGTAAYCHIDFPDDRAPEKSSFKPDGKYKITVLLDSEEPLAKIRAALLATAKELWPDVPAEDINLPWKFHDDDDKNESLRNKVAVIAKTKYRPDVIDARKQAVPLIKKDGKERFAVSPYGGDLVRFVAQAVPYEKTEKVREGKQFVEETVHGISLRLSVVQIIEKRGAAGGSELLDEEEGFAVDGGSAPDTEGAEGEDNGGDF